jgi:hypothetical protein
MEDDKECRVEQHLSVGIDSSPPPPKAYAGFLHLVEKNLAGLRVGSWFVPSLLDHIIEARKFDPEVLKLERSMSLRATIIGKEEGAMVRKRGGKSAKDVRAKAKIPLRIAVKSVKLAEGRARSFVGPSKPAVLQMYLV